jgi:hypothetical protein
MVGMVPLGGADRLDLDIEMQSGAPYGVLCALAGRREPDMH